MDKRIHSFLMTLFFLVACKHASGAEIMSGNDSSSYRGYYQTISLDDTTPCNCDAKTDRTHQLNKGLVPYDVSNYKLHAYQFTFGNTSIPAAKLFKALENDLSVYKVSMKEWQSFMLLTTEKFDSRSFELAAAKAFITFNKMQPEEFLKIKNTTSYLEYIQKLENDKIQQEDSQKLENNQH